MNDPVQQQLLLDSLTQNNTVRTYGGLNEDRSHIWNGVIDPSIGYKHLGIDFNNLDIGDKVASLTDGIVVLSCVDKSPLNGWGSRIIIKDITGTYHLYGHMDNLMYKNGDLVKSGDVIGVVGDHHNNGGWFIHIHYQTFTDFIKIDDVDGYGI